MTYIYHGGGPDSRGGHRDKKTEVIITITERLPTSIQMVCVSIKLQYPMTITVIENQIVMDFILDKYYLFLLPSFLVISFMSPNPINE